MRSHLKKFLFFLVILCGIEICTSVNAVLDFELIGEGFHRTLEYGIDVDGLSEETNCSVAVYIPLPTAVYVNVDEIADLKRTGKTLACSEGEIDVELFAEKAEPQNVTICGELKTSRTILSLPIHQRYKFSQENGGHVAVNLPRPKILLGCGDRLKDHRVSKIDLCVPCADLAIKWREIPYETKSVNIVWLIPVGDVSNLAEVSVMTLVVTCVGAAAVLQALVRSRIGNDAEVREGS